MKWNRILILIVLCASLTPAFAQTSTIDTRLSKIKSKIKFSGHPIANAYIEKELKEKKKQWETALGRAKHFLPEIKDTLKAYGLPEELAYAALGWSMFDHEKISDDGGSGFWQMRYIDAKKYGVYISSFVDMRRDFRVSTSAASRYLRDLYKEYGDWYVSLAAFTMGEVEVNKAIRLSGGTKDYWKFQEHLPEAYRKAIPSFIAGAYIYNFYKDHKLNPVDYRQDSVTSVEIIKWSSLYQVAKAIDSEHGTLKELNPIFKKDVIPNASRTYSILIPEKCLERFRELGDSVYKFPVQEQLEGEVDPSRSEDHQTRNEVKEVSTPATTTASNGDGTKLLYYTVRSGDYLGRIADIYDVGVSKVRSWNGLSGDRINVNQNLKIYVPASKYQTYSKYNTYSRSQLDEIIRKD